jgi:hypothetical protein
VNQEMAKTVPSADPMKKQRLTTISRRKQAFFDVCVSSSFVASYKLRSSLGGADRVSAAA